MWKPPWVITRDTRDTARPPVASIPSSAGLRGTLAKRRQLLDMAIERLQALAPEAFADLRPRWSTLVTYRLVSPLGIDWRALRTAAMSGPRSRTCRHPRDALPFKEAHEQLPPCPRALIKTQWCGRGMAVATASGGPSSPASGAYRRAMFSRRSALDARPCRR